MSNNSLQAMQQRPRFLNNDRLIRFVWLPIPLLLVATAVLWAANLRTVYESQLLLISLNFFCSTLASVLVAVLVGRSFLVSGELGLLMMGCGVICWGVAVTVGSAVALGINAVITIHNTLAFLAAFCLLMGIAIKHAFPNGSGCEVSVVLDHDLATGAACLRVRDNGIGLPADLDWRKSSSLGLRLVQMLAGQMRGTVQAGPGSDLGPGTEFQLNFKV